MPTRDQPFSLNIRCLSFALCLIACALHRIAVADDNSVTVREVRRGERIYIVSVLRPGTYGTITLTADVQNMAASSQMPHTVDTNGKEAILAIFQRADPKAQWSFYWHYHWKIGGRLSGKPTAYLYSLPFRGGPFPISQGPHGAFSHYAGSGDEEAIDFRMPVGTAVCAARPGVVVGVRADSTVGGRDKKYRDDANYVIVRHDDGTFGEYAHIERGGVEVHLGEHVRLGQEIALSGNTGYTTEPHLHFVVFYNIDGSTRKTIPLTFRSAP